MMQQQPPSSNGAAAGPGDQQAYHHHHQQSWMMQPHQQQGQSPAGWNPQSAVAPSLGQPQQYIAESQTPGTGNEDRNLDGSFYGSSDEEASEAYSMNKDTENRREKFHMLGYRDGISAGQEAAAQQGYNVGYKESVLAGYKFGIVRGVSSALAFLPDELREKLVDEQETGDRFKRLHGSVYALSTETAMKLFYGSLTTKQGEEEGTDSSSLGSGPSNDLASYVTELNSLLDKSPKIKVGLDTDEEVKSGGSYYVSSLPDHSCK